jgi:Tol biopolymer transport system component
MNERIDVIDELRRANPVPNEQADEFTYLSAARLRGELRGTTDATVTRIDDAPSSRRPTWRGWPLARAAAVAAVIAGGLVVVTGDGERNTRVETATASVSEPSPPPPYLLDVDTGERTALNIVENAVEFQPSPDGTRLLFYQDGALSIADADGSGVVAIDVQGGPEWRPARWSPDGTRIVYQEKMEGGNVGNLFVHEVATGRRTQVTHLDLTTADWFWLAPSFSPDGQDVVFHLARDASSEPGFDVWSVPVTGGDPEVLVEDAAWPRYLPDGRLVYVASPRSMRDGDTLVIAAADGSTRTLAEAVNGIRRVNVSPGGARVEYVTGDPDDNQDDDRVYVVAVESGEASMLDIEGEWVDDHTLLVGP